VQTFCGRVLSNPSTLFTLEHLRPELQDESVFAEGMENIVQAMRSAAGAYFADGSIEAAVPPLRALLHLMHEGHWQGVGADDPIFLTLFTRETVLASDWYQQRLLAQQRRDIAHWEARAAYLHRFANDPRCHDLNTRLQLSQRLAAAEANVTTVRQPEHIARLRGSIGVDPMLVAG
jgi:hypothetical protein